MRRALRLVFRRDQIASAIDDELAFHVEMRTQQLIAAGFAPEAARREAERQFGDVTTVRDSCVTMDEERERAMKRLNVLDELRKDTVFALRMLRRNAVFTATVVGTLALGIGANTAIFTLIDAVLLRRLPVHQPGQLIAIGNPARTNSRSDSDSPRTDLLSYWMYRELRQRNRLVSGLLATGRTGRLDARIDAGGELEHPAGRFVSGNYFRVLGVRAQLGRMFDGSEDDAVGASPVVTISDGYWKRRFKGDSSVVGREIVIDDIRLTIIGVSPPDFTGEIVGRRNEVWIPMMMQSALQPHEPMLRNENEYWLLLLGRLAPGVTEEQARTGFTTLTRQIIAEHKRSPGLTDARIAKLPVPVSSGARGLSAVRSTFRAPLLTLMVGVGLLLLIICANVANLLLARAVARGREMGVRLALGAARSRLVRQLLTESALLAGMGALAGLALAWWGSHLLLVAAADGASAIPVSVRLDLPVLGFTMALSLLAVGLFGLVPALRASRVDLATSMRASGRAVSGGLGGRGGRVPLGKLLIAGQVALSLVLLVGAGLLVRSLRSVQGADVGLDRDHLLIVDVDGRGRGYVDDRLGRLATTLSERIGRVPGVRAVSFSENGIFSGTEGRTTVHVPGFAARDAEDTVASYDHVGPGYLGAIGARLLEGRDITSRDVAGAAPVIVINETMARFYYPGSSPVGKSLRISDSVDAQIVGVAADTKDHDLTDPPVRRFYSPFLQRPFESPDRIRLEVRTAGDPANLVNVVRREVLAVDATLPINSIDPLTTLMRQSIREQRLLTRLASAFGALALMLAAIGLYGVMTYAITRRTGEIGLRVALGARAGDVVRMVLFDALRLVAGGVVVGIPLALAATRLLRAQLHGVDPADPAAIAVALAVLATSAVMAAMLPAMRAARVSPIVALQQE